MKLFVTGICGQLGHDVVNEFAGRGHTVVGSDIMPAYAGVQDGSAVTTAPYCSLDITDHDAVMNAVTYMDAVIHCGDMTDFGYIHQLEAFAAAWRRAMPPEMPLTHSRAPSTSARSWR